MYYDILESSKYSIGKAATLFPVGNQQFLPLREQNSAWGITDLNFKSINCIFNVSLTQRSLLRGSSPCALFTLQWRTNAQFLECPRTVHKFSSGNAPCRLRVSPHMYEDYCGRLKWKGAMECCIHLHFKKHIYLSTQGDILGFILAYAAARIFTILRSDENLCC